MKFKIKIGEREFEVEILEEKEGVKIRVGKKEFFFKEEKKVLEPKVEIKKERERKILAPIAGEISEIFVKEGDFLKKGQKILTLFSMKMENEILADEDSKIKKILVKEGQKVKKDEVLVILE